MSVIITGCAGFIGSHLVEHLCNNVGVQVIGIDNLSNGSMENLRSVDKKHFKFIKHDIREPIQNIPAAEMIIHLAAAGSVPRSMKQPDFYMENNVMGFHNILELARKNHIKNVIYASSSSVYGNGQKFYRHENDEPAPCSPYAATKYMNEIMAETYERAYWINCVGARFFNVFGPRQKFDSEYAAVIPKFCKGILIDKKISIYGDGKNIRTFTPIDFVVDALTAMMVNFAELTKSIYNVTHQEYAFSVGDLANLIGKVLGEEFQIDYLPPRDGDIKTSVGYGRVLMSDIGELSEDHSLVDAIYKTCQWYRQELNKT